MRNTLIIATLALSACLAPIPQAHAETTPETETLQATIARLDAEVFGAFNACADPARLQQHATFFARDVEFYHDNGGVTWNRRTMLANTKRNVCGNFRRELIPGTLEVFPIKGFGALAKGSHRSCQLDTGQCDGRAEFDIVWQQTREGWRISRVLSYGHRANE